MATADGGRKPLPSQEKIQTTVTLPLGESVTFAGFETKESERDKPERHSKTRYFLRLTKFTPADD